MAGKAQSAQAGQPAPVMLVRGSEGLLADRAVDHWRRQIMAADPATERTDIPAATYQAGQLDVYASPSLFEEQRLIIVPDLELMSDALLNDLLAYVAAPTDGVWLILRHNGGNRGKKLLDAVAKAGFPVVKAEPIKYANDKLKLVQADVRAAGRKIQQDAAQAIVDALGSDLRSMASAVDQLIADTEGLITVEDVHRYHQGKIEATGLTVADAAVTGNTAHALTTLRHALDTGAAPQAIAGALAAKLRNIARVTVPGGAQRANMNRWLENKVRQDSRGWSPDTLGRAIIAVADADSETKGESRTPKIAIEKCVMTVSELRRQGGR